MKNANNNSNNNNRSKTSQTRQQGKKQSFHPNFLNGNGNNNNTKSNSNSNNNHGHDDDLDTLSYHQMPNSTAMKHRSMSSRADDDLEGLLATVDDLLERGHTDDDLLKNNNTSISMHANKAMTGIDGNGGNGTNNMKQATTLTTKPKKLFHRANALLPLKSSASSNANKNTDNASNVVGTGVNVNVGDGFAMKSPANSIMPSGSASIKSHHSRFHSNGNASIGASSHMGSVGMNASGYSPSNIGTGVGLGSDLSAATNPIMNNRISNNNNNNMIHNNNRNMGGNNNNRRMMMNNDSAGKSNSNMNNNNNNNNNNGRFKNIGKKMKLKWKIKKKQ